ncbi:CubicO group peptidase (beta-lactamase class C family) [Microbacterium ginsengiterrae]|uniref:CubicO group peptidase (Beta-lactamase class C family) n=1 Tax=Microbacterium ginsengiterrae TaxID=546115 RepID=A0A7W9FDH2_9MICO|nr:serine hydrolase domain-containing protein [Microbacterium ginsengiterrae]MBB5743294.1 CubicO group peptidase (beta-lactamase class C family) [Microbacterium ginsengiterrae]
MVNGAPGSAWASIRVVSTDAAEERQVVGTPASDDATPLEPRHVFDLASLTKVFTTVAVLRLVEAGVVDLDAPVSDVLTVGEGADAGTITLRHLLTHTAGLPAECGGWRDGLFGDDLRAAALRSGLQAAPGEMHLYSDIGFIAVGELLERASGRALDALVAEAADALGADDLTWRPDPAFAVATEWQPHRGLVRGEVHDELAHALGRPAGHAGLFGTVDDVAALARMIRDEGEGGRARVLSTESVRLMTTPIARADAGYGQAVGLRVRDAGWMGDVDAVGHTGFTGTCFAVRPSTGGLGVLLTNRVHPSRVDTDLSDVRRTFLAPLGAAAESIS